MVHFLSPRGRMLRQHRSADKQLFVPGAGPVPSTVLALQLPGLILSQVPREALLWQIPFGFKGPRGGASGLLGVAPQSPMLGATCQPLAEGARARPRTGCSWPPTPIVCGIGRLFPADLPASGEMWKVRDKNGLYRVRGSFLVQKGRKYLCGILFPPHPSSKKYKEALCL